MNSMAMENLLKSWKVSLYQELIDEIKDVMEEIKRTPTFKYQMKGMSKTKELAMLNKKIKGHEESIKRVEKENSEITNMLFKNNNTESVYDFIENSLDHYGDFTDILQRVFKEITPDSERKIVRPAVLEKCDNGNLFLEGKRYKIHLA